MLCFKNSGFHARFQFVLRIGSLFVVLLVISGTAATDSRTEAMLNAKQAEDLFGPYLYLDSTREMFGTSGTDDLDLAKINKKHEELKESFKKVHPGYKVILMLNNLQTPKSLIGAVEGWLTSGKPMKEQLKGEDRILIQNHWRPYVHRMLDTEIREQIRGTDKYKHNSEIIQLQQKAYFADDSKLVNEFISFWGDLVNLIQGLYQDWSKSSDRVDTMSRKVNGDRNLMAPQVSFDESLSRQRLLHLLDNIPEIDLGDGQITAIKTRVFGEVEKDKLRPMVKALVSLCIGLGALSSISAPGFTMFSSALGGARTGFWDPYLTLRQQTPENKSSDRDVIDEYYNRFMKMTNQLMWIQTRLKANPAKRLFPKERVAMQNFRQAMRDGTKSDDEKARILAHEYGVSWPKVDTQENYLDGLRDVVSENTSQGARLKRLEAVVVAMQQRHLMLTEALRRTGAVSHTSLLLSRHQTKGS